MKTTRTYYKVVFNQDAEHEFSGITREFKEGETFLSRMSENNLKFFLSQLMATKIINSHIISFPVKIFDVYKVTENISYQEEKINQNHNL